MHEMPTFLSHGIAERIYFADWVIITFFEVNKDLMSRNELNVA